MASSPNEKKHEYILEPVSASACLKRNMNTNPLRSRSTPRFTCDLKLEKLPIFLSDLQFNQFISSLRLHDRLEKARAYRKWRPCCQKVRGNACEWWQYAIQCHLDKIQRRHKERTWSYAYERAKVIRKYIKIYCDHLRNPIKISAEMQQYKVEVEQELSFEELTTLRELCMEKVANELSASRANSQDSEVTSVVRKETSTSSPSDKVSDSTVGTGEGILQYWFPAWAGWYSSAETTPPKESPESNSGLVEKQAFEKAIKAQLEEEILYVLSDSMENNTFMKRDTVFAQLSFSLKKGNVTLLRSELGSKSEARETAQSMTERR